MTGKEIRLRKLFGESGKAVVVACDHGMFDGVHVGMEDIAATLKRLGNGADAILLSPGMLSHSGDYFANREAPLAITRLNFNTVFCGPWGYKGSVMSTLFEPEVALARGADAVLVCLTMRSASEEIDARNAENFAKLCEKAHQLGMPVVGEYFPQGHLTKGADEFHEEIAIGCRMLSEYGADCIKTFHTNKFKEIVVGCPVPILGLGAEKTPTDFDALKLAEREVKDGAGGVVFGRNAIQASNPKAFVTALNDVVKHGSTAKAAVEKYKLTK